jgi:hypothetical protein
VVVYRFSPPSPCDYRHPGGPQLFPGRFGGVEQKEGSGD